MPTQKPLKDMIPELLQHVDAYTGQLEFNKKIMNMYKGQIKEEIDASLKTQVSTTAFKRISKRVPHINLLIRVIDKLSRVYATQPTRTSRSQKDQKLLADTIIETNFDIHMANVNALFNLHKCCYIEPFLHNNRIKIRVIPADSFLPFSDDPINPLSPTVIIKFLGTGDALRDTLNKQVTDQGVLVGADQPSPRVQLMSIISDDEQLIIDSNGDIRPDEMLKRRIAPINPFGVIPGVYINRSEYDLIPVPDHSNLSLPILLPILLADLNYAVQFQAHSLVVARDVQLPKDYERNPDTVLVVTSTSPNPSEGATTGDIKVLKPEVDIDSVLGLITATLVFWLESKNLKVGSIGKSSEQRASALAKIVDESDASQDRILQIVYLKQAEAEFWEKFGKIYNIWVDNNEILTKKFNDLQVTTLFGDQQPLEGIDNKIARAEKLLKMGVISKLRALKMIYPELPEQEIEDIINDSETLENVIKTTRENFEKQNRESEGQKDSGNSESEDSQEDS